MSDPDAIIVVEVEGGVVQSVSGIPPGVQVIVRDYDNEELGHQYSEAIYTYEDQD